MAQNMGSPGSASPSSEASSDDMSPPLGSIEENKPMTQTPGEQGALVRRSSLPAPQAYEIEDRSSSSPMPVSLSSIFAPPIVSPNQGELYPQIGVTDLSKIENSESEAKQDHKQPCIRTEEASKTEYDQPFTGQDAASIPRQEEDIDMKPDSQPSCCSTCLPWLCKDPSLIAKGLRLLIIAIIVLSPGLILHFVWPKIKIDDDSPLYWTGILAFMLLGYPTVMYLVNILVYTSQRYEFSWSGAIFYISECQRHISILLYLICFAVLWNTTPLHDTSIWKGNTAVVNKVIFALAISTITFAYKRHLVNKLSLGFNYTNYRDRIKDCLFADCMIHMLQKAKTIYKSRRKTYKTSQSQKQRTILSSSPPPASPFVSIAHPSAFVTLNTGRLIDPGKRWTHVIQRSPSDAKSPDSKVEEVAIDIPRTSSAASLHANTDGDGASCSSAEQGRSSPVNGAFLDETASRMTTESPSTAPHADGTIDPVHFQMEMASFHKLLIRTLDQFHASKSTIFQQKGKELASSEIRSEARALAKRLYKWLVPLDQSRNIVIKKDLACVIDDPAALNRLWGMICLSDLKNEYELNQQTVGSEKSRADFYSIQSASVSSNTTLVAPAQPPAPNPQGHRRMASLATSSPLLVHSPPIRTASLLSQTPRDETIQFYDLADFIERTWMEIIGIAKSMNSMEAAVKKLDVFFSVVCFTILLLFLALFFGDFMVSLTSIATILLGFSFIFAESAKNFFESVIFLFVTHPFDVGDRVYMSMNPTSGPLPPITLPAGGIQLTNASPASGPLENLVVLEMNLITTLFERWDGARLYIPNYVLARRPIINIRRSGALYEVHRLQFSFDTPISKLNELRRRIEKFLKKESADYTEELLMNVETIENLNRMHFLIMVQHRTNWQDFESQLARKSKILMFLKEVVEDLGIVYCPPTQRLEIIKHG